MRWTNSSSIPTASSGFPDERPQERLRFSGGAGRAGGRRRNRPTRTLAEHGRQVAQSICSSSVLASSS
ncbi:hypothetical protein RHECNPAF_1700078 [Rhizobium etli CNPAF512]|nr:hypothetical protein RHECNPAF_1700078 [Rhizobium etli CNPAF512]